MTTPTAEVNRRIAEFCGWLEVAADMHSLTDPPIPIYKGYPPGSNLERWRENTNRHHIPNYMHDANAAIAAAEKYCRERELHLECYMNGQQWAVLFMRAVPYGDGAHQMLGVSNSTHDTLAAAASLALFAVLGGDGIQPTKGTR